VNTMTKYEITEILKRAIVETSPFGAELLTSGDLNDTTNFFLVDLGINSIDYTEIASKVMQELDIDIPLNTFANTNRLSDVIDILFDKSLDSCLE